MNNGVLYAHSALEKFIQGCSGDVHAFGQLLDAEALIVPKNVRTLVIALDRVSSPPAVILEISKVIVSSVYRHTCWAISHVQIELLKAIRPFRANRNTPSHP